ncbi:MFS transporter [Bacillus xiamenensis]|uniref:MFS transporter n=1 Tax=Bacillus xiamenensis TaxID=1178537 RepID=A0AAC9IIG0_9BACI|nr:MULTISPECIES: MFS transporter [Bacillus]AOZ88033.1 MFS transporter [Bacillus xiamenensis]MBG9912200.1 MFS transporter [Bacillus xiamenensis]MCY9574968.1 MFS transporter [Bacillus xiamenensis]QGX66892.1 MFS transporter [Bacillus sp. ms-22]
MDHRQKQVVSISLITAFALIGDSMLYIVLPIYWREVGLSSIWEVGLLLSINRFIRIPLAPVVWWLYRYVPMKTGVLIAILLASVTTMLYGVSGFWLLLICRCAWGLAWTLLRMSGMRLMAEMDEGTQGHLTGLYNGLYRLGSLFGMLFGGVFASLIGFQPMTLVFGLLTLLGCIFYVSLDEIEKGKETQVYQGIKQKWLSREVVKVLLTGMLVALIIQGLFASTLSHVIEVKIGQNGIALLGYVIGASALSGAIQAIRWGWEPFVAPRAGRWFDGVVVKERMLCWMFLSFGALSILGAMLKITGWFLVMLLLLQLLSTILTTLTDTLAFHKASTQTDRNRFLASYSFVQDLGAALGPLLGYTVIQFWGANSVFWLMIMMSVLLLSLWTRGNRQHVSYGEV